MSFFKKRVVAAVLSACVMLGCVGVGVAQRPASLPDVDTGEWCEDFAGVLDRDTEKLVDRYNAKWDNDYSSVMALAVVKDTKKWEIDEYAQKLGEKWGLGQNDFLLLFDVDEWDYYFVYSYQIMNILDFSDVYDNFYSSEFEDAFYYKHDINKAVTSVYEGMDEIYTDGFAAYNETGDGYISHYDYGFGQSDSYSQDASDYVATGIAWALIIWFVLAMIDRSRYKKWYRTYGYYGTPSVNFVPLLFWHKPGGSWFTRMYNKMGGDRSRHMNTHNTTTNPGGYRPGGNYTNYRTPGSTGTGFGGSSTSYRSSGSSSNYRSSGSSSSYRSSSSSSSRGGSFGGSGFGGSGRSSSSSSRGGSFGGGGFGGSSRSSGSRGSSGGSRGGGFGGKR